MSRVARRLLLPLLLCAAASLLGCERPDEPQVVRVQEGSLRGLAHGPATAFKGIPYAAPPVGDLRWAPPQPPRPWRGVREATRFRAVCPQPPNRGLPKDAVQSEDCLTLNVWRPRDGTGKAPVLVWIHGGGDVTGSASAPEFDGAAFARDGVVFVSVQYRLGALGWFAHPALTRATGPGVPLANYGLMDQIAALRWVQRNIARFGGNPKQVTLGGGAAGGEAVLALMSAPAAQGLFQRAIVQSAWAWAPLPDLKAAEAAGEALVARAGAPGADLEGLRRIPIPALLVARTGAVGPARDGRLLALSPAQAFAQARAAAIPLLIGSNTGEDDLLGESDPRRVLQGLTPAQLAELRRAYGLAPGDDKVLGQLVYRDRVMGAPARWVAMRQAMRAPTFLYRFGYVPVPHRLRVAKAGHGAEMAFVFDAMGRAPVPTRLVLPIDGDETTKVHGCWTTFVKSGQPTCPGGPPWPPYDTKLGWLMVFGDLASDEPDSLAPALDLIDGIYGPAAAHARP
jgi:para-nitrobenzyl esterase